MERDAILTSTPQAGSGEDSLAHFRVALARAAVAGLDLDLAAQFREGRRIALPTYAFQHRPYFFERVQPTAEPTDERLERKASFDEFFERPAYMRSAPSLVAGRASRERIVFFADGTHLDDLIRRLERRGHEVVVVRPGDEVVAGVAKQNPERVIHVGCDPATFSRDVAAWGEAGYRLTRLAVLNAFPGTHHFEVMAQLSR